MFELDRTKNVKTNDYNTDADSHAYLDRLDKMDASDTEQFLNVGIDTSETGRAGTFIQKDKSVIHCKTKHDGVEVMGITQARDTHGWLEDYFWKNVSPDKDEFTAFANKNPHEGYFIRSLPGVRAEHPIQSCLFISQENFSQNVHNLVIAEEDSDIHIITGCATAHNLVSGMHVGVSEFYVKKGAKLTFTMIHDWGEKINVRPRTVTRVEEGGILVSNYISIRPVGSLQMFPTTYLDGKNAIARFQSVLVASAGCFMDVGTRVVLNAPGTKAEIISRGIVSGGTIIARGDLVGNVPGIRAHLECKGLILNDGLMRAIPALTGRVPDVEMSHEAAVGKIDRREIEYLMARGLDEEEAVSTIVRGFLNVDIAGLPAGLKKRLDEAISKTREDMM